VGALFVKYDDLYSRDMFVAILAILFCSFGAGGNKQFTGDVE
jgi:hypothetical protein